MNIINHTKPEFELPKFECDKPLHAKLENDPILKLMNKTFLALFLGPPGSGKTSLLTSFLMTKSGKRQKCKASFNKVFHEIHLFMPASSRASFHKSPFHDVPEDQIHDDLTYENLHAFYLKCESNTADGKITLVIFDDVQCALKETEIETLMVKLITNMRHLRCCIMIVAQNYNRISKNVRILATDSFIFNPPPTDLELMHEEIGELNKKMFYNVIAYFRKIRAKTKHTFLYIHDKAKYFVNWDEIVFNDNAITK